MLQPAKKQQNIREREERAERSKVQSTMKFMIVVWNPKTITINTTMKRKTEGDEMPENVYYYSPVVTQYFTKF